MSSEEVEDLLAQLPAGVGREPHADDPALLAYRRGTLPVGEVETLERHLVACRPCRELLAAMAENEPALEVPAARSRRRVFALPIALGGILAAAAAIAVYVAVSPRAAALPPPYQIAAVEGMVASVRGSDAPCAKEDCVILPQGRLLLTLRPQQDLDGPAPQIAAFIAPSDGPLERLGEESIRRGEGGAFLIDAPAARLFGDRFGRWTVHVALAHSLDELTSLAGSSSTELPHERARWLTLPLRYQQPDRSSP